MSTSTGIQPTVEAVDAPAIVGPRLVPLAGVVLLAVILQITVIPSFRVADGTADLVVAVIAAAGWYRGPLVAGVAGFAAGLLVELTTPSGTLGVLALCYLVVGWVSGRHASAPRPSGVMIPLLRVMAMSAAVQLALAAVELLRGHPVPAGELLVRVLVPTVALTVLVCLPFLALVRRAMGAPRVVEPGMRG